MNRDTPLVSVVMTAYNHRPFIREAIDGVLKQKADFDFELIIGEDESPDETRAICQEYQGRYPSIIRLILGRRSEVMHIAGSPTGKRNLLNCLAQCRGTYIAICEGDDYWCDQRKLAKQVAVFESDPECSVCFHRVVYRGGENDGDLSKRWPETVDIKQLAREGNFIVTPSVMYRARFGASYPWLMERTPVCDFPLHMLHATGGSIRFLEDPMAIYRIHTGGMWSLAGKAFKARMMMLTLAWMGEYFDSEEFGDDLRWNLMGKIGDAQRFSLVDGSYDEFKKAILSLSDTGQAFYSQLLTLGLLGADSDFVASTVTWRALIVGFMKKITRMRSYRSCR